MKKIEIVRFDTRFVVFDSELARGQAEFVELDDAIGYVLGQGAEPVFSEEIEAEYNKPRVNLESKTQTHQG